MIIKYLKQFIILNLIFVIFAMTQEFPYSYTAGPEYIFAMFILAGFIASFIVKKNRLLSHSAYMCVNSFVFGFFFLGAIAIYYYRSWSDHSIFEMMIPAMFAFPVISFFVFVGSLIGVIPKAIAERFSDNNHEI